jgi:tetratricopeptide (TPR) repeat protein
MSDHDAVRNEVAASTGSVVQAGGVRGDLHVHPSPPAGAALPVPRQLPGDASHFTGRAVCVRWLDDRFAAAGSGERVVVIAGSPGVGKTTTAVRWAHARRDVFPDGDVYVDLHGHDRGAAVPLEQVLERILRALGVGAEDMPADLDSQTALYRSLLAGRRVLVVLDNAVTADQVRTLLPGSPTCFVVVTSRHRLNGLQVRPGAALFTLDPLEPAESVALLTGIVGAERATAEPDAVTVLARLCTNLPLALRIIAHHAVAHPWTTLRELADGLAVEHDRLDALVADEDETTAVRAVFASSYRALGAPAARLFRLLGLHAGPDVGVETAAALCGEPGAVVRRLLDDLASRHLLEQTGRGRYRSHDLLRVYAAERAVAEESEEGRRAAVERSLEWYLHSAAAADLVLTPQRRHVDLPPVPPGLRPREFRGRGEARQWCEDERANLLAATRQAVDAGRFDIGWKLPVALWGYFTLRTPWVDWTTAYRTGLDAARRTGDRAGEAWTLGGLGIAYRDLRRFTEALASYEESLRIWRDIGDRWGEGWTLGSLAVAYWELERFDEALACSQEALTVFRGIGSRYGEGQALHCFGDACRGMGRYDEATEYLRSALELRAEIGDGWGLANTTASTGDVLRDLGRPAEALERYGLAVEMWREIGDRWAEAKTLDNLAEVLHGLGHLDRAREAWQRSLAICEDLGSPKAAELRARLHG